MSKISPEDIFNTYDNFIGIDLEYNPPDKYIKEIDDCIKNNKKIELELVKNYNQNIILRDAFHPCADMPKGKRRALKIGKTLSYYQKNKTDTSFIELVGNLCDGLGLIIKSDQK